jgi:amino acid transporter
LEEEQLHMSAGGEAPEPSPLIDDKPTLMTRAGRVVFGAPRSLHDRGLFHRISLIAFLAWVGLGADGLSSSAYGPEEAFRTLGAHSYLAVVLAGVMVATILIISTAYSVIIEQFPFGGGGYVVATKLLGPAFGVISGSALLVDYVLTITVSIAAAGDALFSLLPASWAVWKLSIESLFILGLITINIRGVRESVLALAPIFFLFIGTHAILIVGGLIGHAARFGQTATFIHTGFDTGLTTLGMGGLLLLLVHAYSLGGGTYTGIEAVSNGLMIMREPRVRTAKRTMLYMGSSLAFTAAGLLILYLLWDVSHVPGKTMNAVLVEKMASGLPLGGVFVILTLISEGALLIVAAQTGFIDGPRVLANMAIDSWMPHRFSALSVRLTAHNGIALMGFASLAALLYTKGDVRHLVVMYSINVFLTFSLSMFGMALKSFRERGRKWHRHALLFVTGFLLCATILMITILMKFREGGWITLLVTSSVIALCFLIRRHYRKLGVVLGRLYAELGNLPLLPEPNLEPLDPAKPTAAILVGSYGGLGIHTLLNVFRSFPGHFQNVIFLSVGVIDSGEMKGEDALDELKAHTKETVEEYIRLARGMGIAAAGRTAIGIDAVDEAERLCVDVIKEFPRTTFFAGKVIFQREKFYQRLLHNETARSIQTRLQWRGQTMVILPARVR